MRRIPCAAGADQGFGVFDPQRTPRFLLVAAELERALKEPRRALERQALNCAVAALLGRKRGALALTGAFVAGREQLRIAVVSRFKSARECRVQLAAPLIAERATDALAHAVVITFDAPHAVVAGSAAHQLLGTQEVERAVAGDRACCVDRHVGGERLSRKR